MNMGVLEYILAISSKIKCWNSLVLQDFSGYIFKRNFHIYKWMSKKVIPGGSGIGASP